MFIFGQALLQPLIGAECENVECVLPRLSHSSTDSPAVIACSKLSLESVLAEKSHQQSQERDQWFYKYVENDLRNLFWAAHLC